jgi:hypothetical protein
MLRSFCVGSLEVIANFKNLTRLDISATKATDAGLKKLAKLERLTALDLRHTKVTDAGLKRLQRVLPECHIWESLMFVW